MKVNLDKNECGLVKTALVSLAKANNIGEGDMAVLLNLSQKFNFVEEPDKDLSAKVSEITTKVLDKGLPDAILGNKPEELKNG